MYDIAIVGSGPAGVSAVINAKILGKSFVWFGTGDTSKKVLLAEKIDNYPGLMSVTGQELSWALKNHTESLGIEINDDVVTGIYDLGGKFALLTSKNVDYEARTIILCLGVESTKSVKGEDKFVGRGISYCATCDGNLYKGKDIVVLTYDKRYEGEVEFLCSIADNCRVIPLYKNFELPEKAQLLMKSPLEFVGDKRLERIKFKDEEIKTDGLFILKNSFSPTTLLHGLKTEDGHIWVDRNMATNIDGVFAAGDCVGRPYQYAKSVGEGNIAAHSAVDFLSKNKD